MQKNKPNYPLLPTPLSGGLIYPFPLDTSERGMSALISGALARFITAPTSPRSSCTFRREPPGLPARLCPHSCPLLPITCGVGAANYRFLWGGKSSRFWDHPSCQHIVPTATPCPPRAEPCSGCGGVRGVQDFGMSLPCW